ncbi:transglutaminase-like domain-containing protein [Antribacter sp. KLBMP9083]|uniref:Transglutaminase-like domain-containing protein n=1 Tax=Antribacter soli TaxID=2910976 RepID=A0AA41QIN8_9MICO|nr:transglutaminase-like domain-containing protein [Antribacter soli]MCF4122829.1 transglutaminase-like domain-containing protein [Antribacter soli]
MSDEYTTRGGAFPGERAARAGAPASATYTGTGRGTTRRKGADLPRAVTRGAAIDALALVVMLGAVLVGFGPVWGTTGYLAPAVGGTVVGLLVAWLGAWRRWPAVAVLAAAVLAYLLTGGALALPRTTLAGVIPTLDTLRDLLLGAVHGWKEFVTTVPPMHSFPDLAIVPFLLMLVVSLVAGTVAWRARHAAWAIVPVLVGLVGVILLGTPEAAFPLVQGLVITIVALLWGAVRVMEARVGTHSVMTDSSREATSRLRWYRVRTGATMLAVAAVAAGFAGPALLPAEPRTVLRETVTPPLDLHEFTSPLTAFRRYSKDLKETELFTVSGLPEGSRVRLATLDSYDGVVFDASGDRAATGVFTRVGEEITTSATGAPATVTVSVTGYDGVWVPEAGDLTGITWSGDRAGDQQGTTYYNSVTETAITTAGIRPGDTYTLQTLLTVPPAEDLLKAATIADVELPEMDKQDLPSGASAKAAQFTGEETDPVTKLYLLRDALVASGVYSSGLETQPPSRPGHSADRIDLLIGDEKMVGDDEQFAVALALMARQAGIDARVVMGFYRDPEAPPLEAGEDWAVLGGDVHAWVEVPFEGYGWVPIDVIPDEDTKIQPEPKSEQVPKPPVLEEPEPPEEPAKAKAGNVEDDEEDEADNEGFDWGLFGLVLVAVAVPLVLILLPIMIILAYKARRTARRRSADRLVDRVSGGWHEVVDAVTDLGTTVPSGATRREGAGLIAGTHRAPATLTLAHRADATVFGAAEPTEAEVAAFWREVEALVGGLRSGLSRRQRLRAALSLRSIRARAGLTSGEVRAVWGHLLQRAGGFVKRSAADRSAAPRKPGRSKREAR